MKYYIDNVKIQNSTMVVLGWAASAHPNIPVKIEVCDQKGKRSEISRTDTGRYDVNQDVFHGESKLKLGFCILIDYRPENTYYMVFQADGKKRKVRLIPGDNGNLMQDRLLKLQEIFRADTIGRGFSFLKQYGLSAFFKKLCRKIRENKIDYNGWRRQVIPTRDELEAQRSVSFAWQPRFSIIVPLYKTPEGYLREMIDSVLGQTYAGWELCMADGSGTENGASPLTGILSEYVERDARIRYVTLEKNGGISENTNAALAMAQGDYIVLLDHDDVLPEEALYECARCLNKTADEGKPADIIYSDEDKLVCKKGKQFYQDPHFKPDFNPDLLRSMNYISHLFVVKAEIAKQAGGFRKEFDGAQDYDFIFRCTELAGQISHIPKVLYHWRASDQSTAEDPQKKLYAFEAGARAIRAHCERIGIGKVEVFQNEVLGAYRVRYPVKGEPKVSVIIPNKDHIEDLKVCVRSLMEKASYKNLEVLIVENNSTEEETFSCYQNLETEYPKLRVLTWPGTGFNFSAINNYAVSCANGEYLLFLNNDTELINPDCIEELLGFCQREDVGIVGARLFYDDDTIQHAGVIVGYGGIAGHTFIGFHKGEKTYFLRGSCAQDYSAVTAACMMTKKEIFDQVGGFCEELAVAFNDIDYCMKVRGLGKLVVYNPFAQLYHYESKSRGIEDTPERVLRFEQEVETFRSHWPEILEKGDPYYNPNLTLLSSDFSLRDLEKEPLARD